MTSQEYMAMGYKCPFFFDLAIMVRISSTAPAAAQPQHALVSFMLLCVAGIAWRVQNVPSSQTWQSVCAYVHLLAAAVIKWAE